MSNISDEGILPFHKIKVEVINDEEDKKLCCHVCSKGFANLDDFSSHIKAGCGDNTFLANDIKTGDSSYLNFYDLAPKLEVEEDKNNQDNFHSHDAASMNIAPSNTNMVTVKIEDDAQALEPHSEETEDEEFTIEIKTELPPLEIDFMDPDESDEQGNTQGKLPLYKQYSKVEDPASSAAKDDARNLIDSDKPFACRLCDERFAKKYHRTKHMRTHIGEQEFKCFICPFKCFERRVLNVHMNVHISGNPYSCHLCDYRCKDKSTLIAHVKSHAGERPFACSFCEYKSKSREHLKLHLRRHTGDKPFACEYCDYKAARNSILVVHMRRHTGEKPYVCDLCKSRFNQRCHLLSHLRTHMGVRPFTCKTCGYKCTQSSNLKVHMRVHTGEKPYKCTICEQRFNQKSVLTTHIRRHKK